MERCDEGGKAEEGVVHKKLQVYCTICSCVRVVQLYTITDNTTEKYEKSIWGCHFCFTAGRHPPYSVMKFFLPFSSFIDLKKKNIPFFLSNRNFKNILRIKKKENWV
jgi:hypothetical protein